MIIHLKPEISPAKTAELAARVKAAHYHNGSYGILITSSSLKQIEGELEDSADATYLFENDMQLSSRAYRNEMREVSIGDNIRIGGSQNKTLLITGPCSVESEEQITQMAGMVKNLGLSMLRGGAYKPRTSPYSFQGMGLDGLKLLAQMRDQFGLKIITEVRDSTHIQEVIEYSDVIQIGAKSMYDHGILKACGKARKPVMLKRGFGTTLQELVQAAEFILSAGNEDVILCERGIRTFVTKTRFTLDLCGVAWLQQHTNLPIFLDPSHAMGYAYGVPALSKACIAMGVEGLIIESHPNPSQAKSDASQQLNPEEFTALYNQLEPIAQAVGKTII